MDMVTEALSTSPTEVTAFNFELRPYTLYLHEASHLTPRSTPPVLSHETLHGVLTDIGETEAANRLDFTRRYRRAGRYWPEPSGLFRMPPRRR